MKELRSQVLTLGAPADRHGDVYPPGCLKPATVPVTLAFDSSVIVGTAEIQADGSALLRLAPEAGDLEPGSVGIGFVAERWSWDGDVRVLEEIRPVCLGASVSNKGLESQTCPSCRTSRLITVRSIEDTFWCEACKAWRPCAPKKGEPRGYSSSS